MSDGNELQRSDAATGNVRRPTSNFVNDGHVSTVWFMVRRWQQSQEIHVVNPEEEKGRAAVRPHLFKLARMGLDLSGNGSSETVYDEGDGNPAVG